MATRTRIALIYRVTGLGRRSKPTLAAVANAVLDATGVRMRRIPFADGLFELPVGPSGQRGTLVIELLAQSNGMSLLKERIRANCNNALGRELDEEIVRTTKTRRLADVGGGAGNGPDADTCIFSESG